MWKLELFSFRLFSSRAAERIYGISVRHVVYAQCNRSRRRPCIYLAFSPWFCDFHSLVWADAVICHHLCILGDAQFKYLRFHWFLWLIECHGKTMERNRHKIIHSFWVEEKESRSGPITLWGMGSLNLCRFAFGYFFSSAMLNPMDIREQGVYIKTDFHFNWWNRKLIYIQLTLTRSLCYSDLLPNFFFDFFFLLSFRLASLRERSLIYVWVAVVSPWDICLNNILPFCAVLLCRFCLSSPPFPSNRWLSVRPLTAQACCWSPEATYKMPPLSKTVAHHPTLSRRNGRDPSSVWDFSVSCTNTGSDRLKWQWNRQPSEVDPPRRRRKLCAILGTFRLASKRDQRFLCSADGFRQKTECSIHFSCESMWGFVWCPVGLVGYRPKIYISGLWPSWMRATIRYSPLRKVCSNDTRIQKTIKTKTRDSVRQIPTDCIANQLQPEQCSSETLYEAFWQRFRPSDRSTTNPILPNWRFSSILSSAEWCTLEIKMHVNWCKTHQTHTHGPFSPSSGYNLFQPKIRVFNPIFVSSILPISLPEWMCRWLWLKFK